MYMYMISSFTYFLQFLNSNFSRKNNNQIHCNHLFHLIVVPVPPRFRGYIMYALDKKVPLKPKYYLKLKFNRFYSFEIHEAIRMNFNQYW